MLKEPLRKLSLALVLLLGPAAVLLAQGVADSQGYSYDGNRWYEVEVTVFSTDYVPSRNAEIPAPEKTRPAYLPRLRELQAPGGSFDVEFPSERVASDIQPGGSPLLPGVTAAVAEPAPVLLGPLHSPAVPGSFRIADFARTPFIDLTAQAAQFAALNRNLEGSGEHRVLWHKAWRQPMQGRAQTPALFASGGDEYGNHTELEGSLRLSDNGGNVTLDINIWLSRFTRDLPVGDPEWQIPDRPFPLEQTQAAPVQPVAFQQTPGPTLPGWLVTEVWQLEQTRELGANQLYYLDHPALGVLIQLRPYQLPALETAVDEADF